MYVNQKWGLFLFNALTVPNSYFQAFSLLQRRFARNLGKNTAQEYEESSWCASLKNVFAQAPQLLQIYTS